MLKDMLYVAHVFTHSFIKRTFVFEMVDGGGMNFYLGCPKCGDLSSIDRYAALELRKTQEPIHIDQFLEQFE
jgi:hypothetical protein